jgi:hypothetical protein
MYVYLLSSIHHTSSERYFVMDMECGNLCFIFLLVNIGMVKKCKCHSNIKKNQRFILKTNSSLVFVNLFLSVLIS